VSFFKPREPPVSSLKFLIGKTGVVLKAMAKDEVLDLGISIAGDLYRARALEALDALDNVVVTGVSGDILFLNKITVDVEGSVSVTQLNSERTLAESGSVTHFSKTVTGDVVTPSSGKAVKVSGFFFYSSADITVELRFKTSGNVIGGLVVKGACGMNLLGMKKPQGSTDEIVEIYLSGTGTVKGWVSYIEV